MIMDLCRLCGDKGTDMVCVFGEFCKIQQIHHKIERVLQINIEEEDPLPTQLCAVCVNRLDSAFHFISCCHKTQEYLRGLCETSFISVDTEESTVINVFPSPEPTEPKMAVSVNVESKTFTSLAVLDHNNRTNQFENLTSRIDTAVDTLEATVGDGACSTTVVRRTERKRNHGDSEMFSDEIKPSSCRNRGNSASKNNLEDLDRDEIDDDPFESDNNSDGSDYEYCLPVTSKSMKQKQSKCKKSNLADAVRGQNKQLTVIMKQSDDFVVSKDSDIIPCRKEPTKEKKRLTCATCNMSFTQELTYEEHLNVHTGNRPFVCKLCDARFRKRQELNQHLRTIHSEKQFKCPLCEHVAKHKGKLTEHMKSVHEKPFACDQCNYRTGEKGKIQQHIANKHNGDLSYVCEICGNGFRTRTSLQAHRQNIHFPEPKVCQTCGTVCPSLARYSAHIFRCGKEKRRYPCDKCGQTYVNKEILKDHMNKHLNVRPYKCDVCGKEFFQRNRLDTHKYVHRGAAYRCEICNQSFNRKDNMKNHMKKHFYKSMRYDNMIVTAV